VEVELPRRRNSGRSSLIFIVLAKLPPYKLDPGATDAIDWPQSLLAHCHAISGPLPSAMSARCLGGGSGGGTGSLAFGIDIGMEEVAGDEAEVYELDLLDVRNRSGGLESWI
jgi:hypothetical protein